MASTEKGKQDVRNLLGLHLGEYDGAHPFEGVAHRFPNTMKTAEIAAGEVKAGNLSRDEAEAKTIEQLDDECNELFGNASESAEEREFEQVLNALFSR